MPLAQTFGVQARGAGIGSSSSSSSSRTVRPAALPVSARPEGKHLDSSSTQHSSPAPATPAGAQRQVDAVVRVHVAQAATAKHVPDSARLPGRGGERLSLEDDEGQGFQPHDLGKQLALAGDPEDDSDATAPKGLPDEAAPRMHVGSSVAAAAAPPAVERLAAAVNVALDVKGHPSAAPLPAFLKPADSTKVRELGRAYQDLLPRFVVKADPERAASTARALARHDISPSTVRLAGWMGRLCDSLAQTPSSLAAYGASFVVFNTALMHLTAPPEGSAAGTPHRAPALHDVTLAALAMVASSIPVQRMLRTSEMLPGWTAAVEESADGTAVHMLDTDMGKFKVGVQYWPFLGSLLSATFYVDGVEGKLAARRLYGTFATLGVASHRMFAFTRDLPWLDGRTEASTRAMLQHIHELTDVRSLLAAAAAYCLRPMAGLAGLIGIDVLGAVEDIRRGARPSPPTAAGGGTAEDSRRAAGTAEPLLNADESSDEPYVPARRLAPGLERLCSSSGEAWPEFKHLVKRAACILVPILVLEALTGNVAEGTNTSWVRGVVSDGLLVGLWGVGMLVNEQLTRREPGIHDEIVSRRDRNRALMDAKYQARTRRDDHGPQGGGQPK